MPSFKSLAELDTFLSTRSYITGYSISSDDSTTLSSLPNGNVGQFKHVNRWAKHIAALTGVSVVSSSSSASSTPAAATADSSMDDMFYEQNDDETEEEKAATIARQKRMAEAKRLKDEKDAKEGKKKKEKEAEKSLLVLEVKPWEADTDLEMVWKKIIEYKQDGLTWGATFKLEPVAFGIKKLILTATIVDSMVLMDDITDNIEALEDFVQSVQVVSMNKI